MKDRAQILELIAHSTREVLPDLQSHAFTESDRLADLGANSVDRAEIAMLVQEALNLTIPRVELFGPTNIGELAELFVKRLNGL
jgi:polyketide biosynthesis acyl carrier protein